MRFRILLLALLTPLALRATPVIQAAQRPSPAPDSSLRITVTPDEASVYVDGYLAGSVSDFDGESQRLVLPAGQHEVVIHLDGYRSLRQHVYLGPNTSRRLNGVLEPLAPGEPNEPIPTPRDDPRPPTGGAAGLPPPPQEDVRPAQAPAPAAQPRPGPPVSLEPDRASPYGILSLRIIPGNATLKVDGQTWKTGSRKDQYIVQVTEGRHVVQVERKGYEPFSVEVDVDAGETLPVNVTLVKR